MLRAQIWPLTAAALILGGCSKEVPVATVGPYCKAVTNVCVSKDDVLTEGTATQIEANNLGRKRLCGKPPKCKA